MANSLSYREDARIYQSRIHECQGRAGRAWTCVTVAVESLLLILTRPSDHTKFVGKAHEHPVRLDGAALDISNVMLMCAASRRTSSSRLTVKHFLRASSKSTNSILPIYDPLLSSLLLSDQYCALGLGISVTQPTRRVPERLSGTAGQLRRSGSCHSRNFPRCHRRHQRRLDRSRDSRR